MSVGGRIIDTIAIDVSRGTRISIWTMDRGGNECQISVLVPKGAECPAIGDQIWWQGRKAFWTSADSRFEDRELERIGYSHPPHPADFDAPP